MDDFVSPLAAESNKNVGRRLGLEGNDERLPRCELKPITEHQIVGTKDQFLKVLSLETERKSPISLSVCVCLRHSF